MKVIETSAEIMGGTPVFKGTRVPLQTFIDYLEAGDSTNDFLSDFPTVSKEQVINALESMRENLVVAAKQ
jgi:uncharacterized protein (DUF433 family)